MSEHIKQAFIICEAVQKVFNFHISPLILHWDCHEKNKLNYEKQQT